MDLQKIIEGVFIDLEDVLLQIDDRQFAAPSKHLFCSSIGQHLRHILEMFQSLICGYDDGIVNYDLRARNKQIETDKVYAIEVMHAVLQGINRPSRSLMIEASFGMPDRKMTIESNYTRELLYNLEHTIHHMALIKVGINELTDIVVSDTFGVAPSTIQYRTECAR